MRYRFYYWMRFSSMTPHRALWSESIYAENCGEDGRVSEEDALASLKYFNKYFGGNQHYFLDPSKE